jgi:hypothetical protein
MGHSTGLVLGETPRASARAIAAFKAGRLRCLVNVAALTTGFDVQEVDMLVMRRRTMSLGLYIQMTGRLLRTIGGTLTRALRAGKADGLVLDFAGNIDQHGPLDFIRPKDTKARLVSCEDCGKRNGSAAARCWSCDAVMMKLCPGLPGFHPRGTLDCPHCDHDMRTRRRAGDPKPAKLLETPSGAALIAAFGKVQEKAGGWIPIRKAWEKDGRRCWLDNNGDRWELPAALAGHAVDARWVRGEAGVVAALLKPNGANRSSVLQMTIDGAVLPVPMPRVREAWPTNTPRRNANSLCEKARRV